MAERLVRPGLVEALAVQPQTVALEQVLSDETRGELGWGDEGPFNGRPVTPVFIEKGSSRVGKITRNGAIASADVAANGVAKLHAPRTTGGRGNGTA